MSKITKQRFLNSTKFYKLYSRVIKQSGGWSIFKENARDISNYGVNGGFHGWIYYKETVPFAKANLMDIVYLAMSVAKDLDIGVFEMIANFKCNEDFSSEEVIKVLTGIDSDFEDQILNCLAWFACEEVTRNYVDLLDSSEYS